MIEQTMADVVKAMLLSGEEADDSYVQDAEKQMIENGYRQGQEDLIKKVTDIYAAGQIPSIRDGLHFSDLQKQCWRKFVLLALYKQNPVIHGALLSARFDNGNAVHTRWQENVKRALGECQIEEPYEEAFWHLLVTPDIIAPFPWDDAIGPELTIWEIKGYRSKEWRDEKLRNKLPKDAIVQNTLYQWITGIHKGLVIVENKDTQEILVFAVPYDESLVEPYIPVLDKIAKLVEWHKQDGRLPRRLEECTAPGDEKPKSCPSCDACFADVATRKKMRRPSAWEEKQ